MQLEDYLDFLAPNIIRLKGTRVGIETIINDYLNGRSPEEILHYYPGVTLEQVFATLTYYYRHQEVMEAYIQAWREEGQWAQEEQQHIPSSRMREIKEMLREQTATYEINKTMMTSPQKVLELAQLLSLADQSWLVEMLSRHLAETLPEKATLDEAIELYLADACSLGRAAELAGVTRWDIQDILKERGLTINGGSDLTLDEIETMIDAVETRYGRRK